MKKYILPSVAFMALVPSIAFAQVNNASSLIQKIKDLVGEIMPLLVGLAVLFFVYAVLKFIMNAGDEEAQKEARSMMIWGIVAIFVMVSVWGLVGILTGTFGFNSPNAIDAPKLPTT